jgi:DNA-binding NarL/FixJ family response regulator
MRNINILLVAFQKITGDGLKAILGQKKDINLVVENDDFESILKNCSYENINLIILNVDNPVLDAVPFISQLKVKYPESKILAVTDVHKDQYIRQLFHAGISGLMLKDSGSDELYKAIDTLMEGSLYLSEVVTQAVMQRYITTDYGKQRKEDPFSLTDRETEVLGLIVREFTNQEIAEKLSISVRTVESHRRNLLQKTGARNTAGLVRYAIENKIIT